MGNPPVLHPGLLTPGESRLTEVVGQIPPGTTVFVLELRNERGSGARWGEMGAMVKCDESD